MDLPRNTAQWLSKMGSVLDISMPGGAAASAAGAAGARATQRSGVTGKDAMRNANVAAGGAVPQPVYGTIHSAAVASPSWSSSTGMPWCGEPPATAPPVIPSMPPWSDEPPANPFDSPWPKNPPWHCTPDDPWGGEPPWIGPSLPPCPEEPPYQPLPKSPWWCEPPVDPYQSPWTCRPPEDFEYPEELDDEEDHEEDPDEDNELDPPCGKMPKIKGMSASGSVDVGSSIVDIDIDVDVDLPEFEWPDFELPELGWPDFDLPNLPIGTGPIPIDPDLIPDVSDIPKVATDYGKLLLGGAGFVADAAEATGAVSTGFGLLGVATGGLDMYGAAKDVYDGVADGTLNSDTLIDSTGDFFLSGATGAAGGLMALAGVAEAPIVGALGFGYGVGDFVGEHIIDPYLNRPKEIDAMDLGESYDADAGEPYNPDDDMAWRHKPADAVLDWLED